MALTTMSRPQIGIDRLPPRRTANEPRELMNCKSCRKRKIKCNRLRPSCEACQVFAVPCIYDAVPKKRGPKTDVLEALLKRVDGLEKRLKPEDRKNAELAAKEKAASLSKKSINQSNHGEGSLAVLLPELPSNAAPPTLSIVSPNTVSPVETINRADTQHQTTDVLIETYFARIHGQPFYIVDEASIRQRIMQNQIPNFLILALYAVSSRFSNHIGDRSRAVQLSSDYANQSRQEIDIDEPSIDALQALLLLSHASFQSGTCKKAYMFLSAAISMSFALSLHIELPASAQVPIGVREGRRRLFWACYILDRFFACGSKRPSLISDECVQIRLPFARDASGAIREGSHFSGTSTPQYMRGGLPVLGASGMLIEITRILGMTNRYLAAGGPKSDSRFPWHQQSNLSKIRQELELWATEAQDTFQSLDILFAQQESTILALSKLVYHLIHCLLYRPFIPVDLFELSATGQDQSWRIEATNLCFFHANTITELIDIWKTGTSNDVPSFAAYCLNIAGTIHAHGAHYRGGNSEAFSMSKEFLTLELRHLAEMKWIWESLQYQFDHLHAVYTAHSELVKSAAGRPSPIFNYDDFLDRYHDDLTDGAFLPLDLDTFGLNLLHHPPRASPMTAIGSQIPLTPGYVHSGFFQSPTTGHPPKRRRLTVGENSANDHEIGSRRDRKRSMTAPSPSIPPRLVDTLGTQPMSEQTLDNYSFTSTGIYESTNPPPTSGVNAYDPMLSMSAQFDVVSPRMPVDTIHESNGLNPRGDALHSIGLPSSSSVVLPRSTSEPDTDQDHFLGLLEQLAEKEQSRGGHSDLDFFLSNN